VCNRQQKEAAVEAAVEIHHVEAEAKAKAEVEAQQMEAMGKRPDPHSVLSRRR